MIETELKDDLDQAMAKIIERLDSVAADHDKNVSSILAKMNAAVVDSTKESFERKFEAYQRIIDKINEQSTRIASQQMELINAIKSRR